MKPIIGIVPRVMTHSNNYKVQVNENYFTPFNNRDVNTIVLPLNSPNILELLPLCDGFLLPGGDDIDPTCYGQTNDEGLSKVIAEEIDDNEETLNSMIPLWKKKKNTLKIRLI